MKARDAARHVPRRPRAARTEVTFMLYVSLFASGLLLIVVNLAVRGKYPLVGTIGACAIAAIGPMFVMLALKAVWLQAALLCVALLVLLVPGRGRRLYLPASVATTLIAYGITGYSAFEEHREHDRLRKQFAFESLEDRLPLRPTANRPAPADPTRLTHLEDTIAFGGGFREESLKMLHERQVQTFVNSPGFGVTRMGYFTGDNVKIGERPPIPQPGLGRDSSPPDRWDPVAGSRFDSLHEASVLDFVNPRGFGWVKDRRHVAGFQKHGFSKVPGPADTWKVGTIDLIGLLLHPEPVAYVSANLPRMDELRDAPTRQLDPFEAEGLDRLRGGEELFARGSDRQVRMLGAVRATKQCLGCHGGDRGDLLGAFSYTLRREE